MTEQLNRRYVMGRLLGRGGMGEVFAGRALGLEGFSRPVAIKRIHSRFSDDRELRPMLVTEARLTARLVHQNIVPVFDLDQDDTGRMFLVMELVDGVDLARLYLTGPLPLSSALFITCEILRGLSYAHDLRGAADEIVRGLVHRDVSPQNVLIGWDGSVKVADFGLAKVRVAAQASASINVRGKPGYVSPEQANGDALDGRSDLFSVGIMLWELLCGQRLFGHGATEAKLRSLLLEPIPSPRSRTPELPEDIEHITMRLLERDLSRRYPAADAVIEALQACAAFPKNGHELIAALLRERLPDRSQHKSDGGARAPAAPPAPPSDEETANAPPVAPRLVAPGEPYPDTSAFGRPRRLVLWIALVVAMALATALVLPSVLPDDDSEAPDAPAARGAPPVESLPNRQPTTSAPPQISPAPAPAPARLAPALISRPPPVKAPVGRAPSKHQAVPAPAGPQGIRVIDLRELALTPDERRKDPP